MAENKPKLTVIDGETLMDTRLEPTKFCIDTLLPQGITILGGAPKIGKSWWVWIFVSASPKEKACGVCRPPKVQHCIFAWKIRSGVCKSDCV